MLQLEAESTGELVEIQVPPGARPGAVLQVEVPDVETEPPSLEEYFLRPGFQTTSDNSLSVQQNFSFFECQSVECPEIPLRFRPPRQLKVSQRSV